ncbi:uncharacterized protein LOC106142404 isoform X1 [Amyelois transitella]|uniref:uncharacterized protein LOC106142404 isoform X1 n=2 Tax=Amyelois transitella TaxID=680683 RepID=UPI00067C1CDA|nr:uncharacterized protein LOC106142404 isoform X1 [Amyelois transitella]
MKCLLLGVFVFVFASVNSYNFDTAYYAPFGLRGPRSRFDYDFTKLSPQYRTSPIKYDYFDNILTHQTSSENPGLNKNRPNAGSEAAFNFGSTQKIGEPYKSQDENIPVDIQQQGMPNGYSYSNTEGSSAPQFQSNLRTTTTSTTAEPTQG